MSLISKYKHISFDLDDTLVHTISDYRYWLVSSVVEKLGGENPTLPQVDEFWFGPDRDTLIWKNFNLAPKKFWNLWSKMDNPRRRSRFTFVYYDAEECLLQLNKMGKLTSIITGSPVWISKMEVRKLNNAPVDFYLATTAHKRLETKPDPSGMHYVLERLGISASQTVYIGNSNEDAIFAQNAGVDFIYLERRQHRFDFRKNAQAIIKTLDELR